MRRVAITGVGVVSAVGNNPIDFFDTLMAGQSGIRRISDAFAANLSVRIAGQVTFDPLAHFAQQKLIGLDRFSQFALVAASQAVQDGRLTLPEEDKTHIGVSFGTGLGGAGTMEEGYLDLYKRETGRVKPMSVLMAMNNAAAAHVALTYELLGPNLTFSTACSSSAIAIGEAYRLIRHGYAEVMLAGGSEALLTYGTMRAWEALRALAVEDAADPAASCRPFSKDRTGLVLGEGAAVLYTAT